MILGFEMYTGLSVGDMKYLSFFQSYPAEDGNDGKGGHKLVIVETRWRGPGSSFYCLLYIFSIFLNFQRKNVFKYEGTEFLKRSPSSPLSSCKS